MKKQDLKNMMIVEIRAGVRYLKVDELFLSLNGFMDLESYDDYLRETTYKMPGYDIVKIYTIDTFYGIGLSKMVDTEKLHDRMRLLWERKEIKLSDREIEVLKAFRTIGYATVERYDGDIYFQTDMGSETATTYEVDELFTFIKDGDAPRLIDDLLKGVLK